MDRMNDLKLRSQTKQLYFILYPIHLYILLFLVLVKNWGMLSQGTSAVITAVACSHRCKPAVN